MQVYPISIPQESLILHDLPKNDYQDAYAIQLPSSYAVAPEQLVHLFFQCMPVWAKVLLGIREGIAKIVGLKTAIGMDVAQQLKEYRGEPGQSIALFHTKGRTDCEIMTGEEDSHLDFRLSFFGNKHPETFEIILATTVLFKGWSGRLYFLPVKPIHRLLVKTLLKRMAKRLRKEGEGVAFNSQSPGKSAPNIL